jgi:hypothetical protein
MEYFLSIVFILGFIPFVMHYFKCYRTENPGLAYVDRSIKSQLFILSKDMVILLFAAIIWTCRNHPDVAMLNKIIIPVKLATALFISIKVLPENYISTFQFGLESGIKEHEKFSPSHGRFFEILFLSIAMIVIGISILGVQIYYLITNSYDLSVLETNTISQEIYNLLHTINLSKVQETLRNLNSCAHSSLFLVIIGTFLALSFTIANSIIYFIDWYSIKKANKNKTGILKTNNYTLFKRHIGVLGALLLIADIIITYAFYYKICDLLSLANVIKYTYIYKYSKVWFYFTNTILIFISIAIASETLKVIIKLSLYYKHKRKVLQAIKIQEKINKNCDFTAKLMDYQFNVFRFMYEPIILKNKPATLKNVKEMITYITELNVCKICIFFGVPLIFTNDLLLAYRCYKTQMKLCR